MYEGLSSPNIHTPENLSEYSSIVLHYPSSSFWAGGTFLMTRPDAYPARNASEDIIYLGSIEELHKFQRNDRLAEFGSMVTLDALAVTGKSILPKVLLENINAIGGRIITQRATLGGAICTKDFTTSIPGTMIVLDAYAEVRFVKSKRVHSRWIQINRLLDKNGKIVLPSQGMISRLRIAFTERNFQYFTELGSYMTEPENAVAVSFVTSIDQDILISPRLAITYPLLGLYYSRDMDNVFSSLRLPLSEEEYLSLESQIFTFIESSFPTVSPLQKARTRGALREIIDRLNEDFYTVPSEN